MGVLGTTWYCIRVARCVSPRTLLLLLLITTFALGLRSVVSPRTLFDTNYHSLSQIYSGLKFSSFNAGTTVQEVLSGSEYYAGCIGYPDCIRLLRAAGLCHSIHDVFMWNGLFAGVKVLLLFFFMYLLFKREDMGLVASFLYACFPISLRLSCGDSVYGFGMMLLLLSCVSFLIFVGRKDVRSFFVFLCTVYCTLLVHVSFLLFPFFLAMLFIPVAGGDVFKKASTLPYILVGLFFFLLLVPVYYIDYIHIHSTNWFAYPSFFDLVANTLFYLFHPTNIFFDHAYTPLLYMFFFVAGLWEMCRKEKRLLLALCGGIFLLSVPLPQVAMFGSFREAVWPNIWVNTNIVKQEYTMFLYLVLAAYGGVSLTLRMRHEQAVRAVAVLLCLLIAIQPYVYRSFIGKKYNYQRNFFFISMVIERVPIAVPIFSFGGITGLIGFCLDPARPQIALINHVYPGAFHEGVPQVPEKNDVEIIHLLDTAVSKGGRPLVLVPLSCYYQHPGDTFKHTSRSRRDEYSALLRRYVLKPVLERSFPSEVYDPESDSTLSDRITLGLYQVISRKK